jgi:hypothetical protein
MRQPWSVAAAFILCAITVANACSSSSVVFLSISNSPQKVATSTARGAVDRNEGGGRCYVARTPVARTAYQTPPRPWPVTSPGFVSPMNV